MLRLVLSLCLLSATSVQAETLLDQIDLRQKLQATHEVSDLRQQTQFNPELFPNEETHKQLSLDTDAKLPITTNVSSSARLALFWDQNEYLNANGEDTTETESDALLLEGDLSLHSRYRDKQIRIGRINTNWSQGFNWNVADILKPNRTQPSFDDDNLRQQQGIDMVMTGFRRHDVSYTFIAADVNNDYQQDNSPYQAAMRVAYEGDLDVALIWQKLENSASNWAFTFSSLLTDSTTFRIESAYETQRQLPNINSLTTSGTVFEDGGYLKSVVSLQASIKTWDVSVEYLFTEHGYDKQEQDQWNLQSTFYEQQLNTVNAAQSYQFFGNSSSTLNLGQLNQQYAYFSYGNLRSNQLFSWRQSVQINLQDDSQYHKLELGQKWNSQWESRLQTEWFNGCDECEFGRVPSEYTVRLSVYLSL